MQTISTFVHRFVPAREGALRLTLLLLHGTGGDESSLLPVAAEVAPGVAALSLQGKTIVEGQRRFFPMSADGEIDHDELAYQAAEIVAFVHEAAGTYGFDLRRVVGLGYSNGAAMTATLLLTRPRLLAGGMILRPVLPPIPTRLPDLAQKPVLVAGGRRDELAPPADSQRLASAFRAANADVTLRWEEAGHKLRPAEMQAIRHWLVDHFS